MRAVSASPSSVGASDASRGLEMLLRTRNVVRGHHRQGYERYFAMCHLGPEDLLCRILTTPPWASHIIPACPSQGWRSGEMIRWRSGVVCTYFGIISPVWVLRLLSHQICGHHFGVSGEVTLWPISFGKQTKFPLEVTLRSCRRCDRWQYRLGVERRML